MMRSRAAAAPQRNMMSAQMNMMMAAAPMQESLSYGSADMGVDMMMMGSS